MANYYEKRRKRYYAVMEIPEKLRDHFGARRWVKSLQTDSEAVAKRRAPMVVGMWKQQIAQARGEPNTDDALYWRRVLKGAKSEGERRLILDQIHDAAELLGMETVDEVGMDPTSSPEAQRFYAEAVGWDTALAEHIEEWIASKVSLKARTRDIYKADAELMAEEFKRVQDVTKPAVRRWATKLLNRMSSSSVLRVMAACRSYWQYLQSINVAREDDDPFSKLKIERKTLGRLPFEPEQVVGLWRKASQTDRELADLIWFAMFTGSRIEEIAAIKLEDIGNASYQIPDAKTEAGVREVPIHPDLAPVVARLRGTRTAGYLFDELKANKYGDRSNTLSQRFGRLKTNEGYGPKHVFHSIRKTVTTIFENALVPEGVAADIVGHDKPTMTYGLYSGGASLEVKAEAIKALKYPGVGSRDTNPRRKK